MTEIIAANIEMAHYTKPTPVQVILKLLRFETKSLFNHPQLYLFSLKVHNIFVLTSEKCYSGDYGKA